MPTLTIKTSIVYTDATSGAGFDLSASKSKSATHPYRQVVDCPDGIGRRLIKIGDHPSYTNMVAFTVKNIGNYDVIIQVVSGGAQASIAVPPGRTHKIWNVNMWRDTSATDPDTIDEILGEGLGGSTTVKFDAFFR